MTHDKVVIVGDDDGLRINECVCICKRFSIHITTLVPKAPAEYRPIHTDTFWLAKSQVWYCLPNECDCICARSMSIEHCALKMWSSLFVWSLVLSHRPRPQSRSQLVLNMNMHTHFRIVHSNRSWICGWEIILNALSLNVCCWLHSKLCRCMSKGSLKRIEHTSFLHLVRDIIYISTIITIDNGWASSNWMTSPIAEGWNIIY